jgi:pilus assembly protein CpaE
MNHKDADADWTVNGFDDDYLLDDSLDLPANSRVGAPDFEFDDGPIREEEPFEAARGGVVRLDRDEHDDILHDLTDSLAAGSMVGAFASSERDADQPVPSIKIMAFCDRPGTERLINGVAGDRRLAKADVSAELGGVDSAIARLSAEPSPDLLIIDSTASASNLLGQLDRLAEVVEPGCKVMVVGEANDIALYRELMRRGVSEYLVAPLEPVAFIRSIGALYADPDRPFVGRVAAVIGARGGVGASTIAHNIAWSVAVQQQANATLVDLDLPFGTAALDFNEEPSQSILDALAAPERVDEVFLERVVSRPVERLRVFNAPAKLDRLLEMDPAAVSDVLDKVRRTGPHIILDMPHGWNGWTQNTLLGADDIVIVASPDLASLRNAKHIFELCTKARKNDAPPMLVLNTVGMPRRPEIPIKDFGEHVGVAPIAEIPFDPAAFGAASNNGQMLLEHAPASKASQAIVSLAATLTGRMPAAPKRSSLLSRLPPILKR